VREIDSAKELLNTSRLLTITGSGGTGKTRISLQIAADLLDRFPDGVWFVELAALTEPTAVFREVARVLNVREAPGVSLSDTIVGEIQLKQMLLVLDNCEHMLDAVAGFARRVLQNGVNVKMIATSREAIGVSGERIYRLPSMGVPERDRQYTPERLADYESVQLFRERARLANSEFEITERNSGPISAVCRRLDGIPLAIELAAARVRAMPVEEVERRLDVPFKLLTGGGRDVLPRQQTLRALIDWSYDLLNEQEKTLLRRLSVFRGGWRLEDAEASLGYGAIETWDVLDLLTSLVDKSLVAFEDPETYPRYRLLETVRQYGGERLVESGEDVEAISHHLRYYRAFAAKCIGYCNGPEQTVWLLRLAHEHENVRAAHERALAGYGIKEGLQLCRDLRRFWMIRGFVLEGVEVCDRALKLDVGPEFPVERGYVLHSRGTMCLLVSQYDQAITDLHAAVGIFEQENELEGLANAEDSLGSAIRLKGDLTESIPHFEKALGIFRQIGDPRGEAVSLNNLGRVAEYLGDLRTAKKHQMECLTAIRKVGEPRTLAIFLFSLALVEMKLDELDPATKHFSESARVIRAVGDPLGGANLLEAMATLTCRRSLYSRAVVMWGAAETLRQTLGAPMVAADRPAYDANVEEARQTLGAATFDAERSKGRTLSLDEALDFAADAT
jgi:predicted ATPase